MLTRYWIEFDHGDRETEVVHFVPNELGITAFDIEDAKKLISDFLEGRPFPKIKRILADIKYDQLEEDHVRKNTGSMAVRGIWYPNIGRSVR